MESKNIRLRTESLILLMNSVGAVFQDSFVIHQYGKVPVAFERLEKISLQKRRSLVRNITCFLTAIAMILLAINFSPGMVIQVMVIITAIAVLYMAFRIGDYHYHLVMIKNSELIKVDVHKNFKQDAKSFVHLLNKKIKEKKASESYRSNESNASANLVTSH